MTLSLINLRQSAAELLACVVVDLFPGAVLVNSNANEFGFYYDFIAEQPIDQHALVFLEEKMRALAKQNVEVRKLEMMRENAASFLTHKQQPFIAQRVLETRDNIVSLIQIGEFCDYCPYPHMTETQEATAFKLLKVEQAIHYVTEEGEVEVTRIFGTACRDAYALKKHLKALEAGKKKDHRKFSSDARLFQLLPEVSECAWCWDSQGAELRSILLSWWEKMHRQAGFRLLVTPPLICDELLNKAGFYDQVAEGEYPPFCEIEGVEYVVPTTLNLAHAAIFQSKAHKYRDLPVKYAQCGYVSNADKRNHLWGLLAAQLVYADEAHTFCATSQVENELISSLQFIDKIIKMFTFEYHWYLKGQSDKFAGTASRWKKSTECLLVALEKSGINYTLDETESSYAGPVVEVRMIDSLKREWRGPSVGFDFNLPDRFDLRFLDEKGEMQRPVMLVSKFFGSLERFVAILIEHYAGNLPMWLAPTQVKVVAVGSVKKAYLKNVLEQIAALGYRTGIDERDESLGTKIHTAESEKIPYIIIVGEKEEKQNLITVRSNMQEAVQGEMTLEAFVEQLKEKGTRLES